MLAAIHIRQIRIGHESLTCAAVATETDIVLFTRDGDSETDRNLLGLDAFAALYESARESSARLHISDAGLRRTLMSVSESFPAVEFVDTVFGPFSVLLRRAADAIGAHVAGLLAENEARREAERAARPPLMVATDASKGRNRRGTGLGCITENGAHRMRVDAEASSILEGELLAIEMATARFADRNLHILTDSRLAVACLEGTYHGRPAVTAVVERIRSASRGRSVQVSWVRGHNGHPLNEAAHRLAMAARRCHEANVLPEARAAIVDNIVASLDAERSQSA